MWVSGKRDELIRGVRKQKNGRIHQLTDFCSVLFYAHPTAHTQYENLWATISRVFKAALGELLEFAKTIIDKLGSFLCDSGDVYSKEAVAPPSNCGLVGQVCVQVSGGRSLSAYLRTCCVVQ